MTMTPSPEDHPFTDPSATPSPVQKAGWRRHLVRGLAVLGVLFIALVGWVGYSSWQHHRAPLAETATIEENMTEVFGRYSPEHEGWLYVANTKRSYVMRVVQQASVNNKNEGDGVYFVASGTPLDGEAGTLFGVFHLFKDKQHDGTLTRNVTLYTIDDVEPLTPDHVKFEALSPSQWAWVIKRHQGKEEEGNFQVVTDTILAPHQGTIKELATYVSQIKHTPVGGCARAEADFAEWQRDHAVQPAAGPAKVGQAASGAEGAEGVDSTASAKASEGGDAVEGDEGDEGEAEIDAAEVPDRCYDERWAYRTDPPKA
ncbi:MAG: hypothetical protein RI907_509, partial [Pseudomonadota bacterium]